MATPLANRKENGVDGSSCHEAEAGASAWQHTCVHASTRVQMHAHARHCTALPRLSTVNAPVRVYAMPAHMSMHTSTRTHACLCTVHGLERRRGSNLALACHFRVRAHQPAVQAKLLRDEVDRLERELEGARLNLLVALSVASPRTNDEAQKWQTAGRWRMKDWMEDQHG